jgi:hypothetical protein
VTALRQRIGERLLTSGAEMAFDRQHIARGIARTGTRAADDPVLAQALLLVQLISRVKVKLGLLILP